MNRNQLKPSHKLAVVAILALTAVWIFGGPKKDELNPVEKKAGSTSSSSGKQTADVTKTTESCSKASLEKDPVGYGLPSGTPNKDSYEKMRNGKLFKLVEEYSNTWLDTNRDVMNSYGQKWVKDPLHWWSRVWEYTFIYSAIMAYARPGTRMLDVGSGVTFLPYMLTENIPHSTVECLDYDTTYTNYFEKLNSKMKTSAVQFIIQDLREKIAAQDNSVDIVYCTSVLEHTDNYAAILNEIQRILKPGGLFIVTFDIALPGETRFQISVSGAEALLKQMRDLFTEIELVSEDNLSAYNNKPVQTIVDTADIVTADWCQTTHPVAPYNWNWRLTFSNHVFKKKC